MSGYSRKETDFFGNEKMVHYDDRGRKVGSQKPKHLFSAERRSCIMGMQIRETEVPPALQLERLLETQWERR